MRFFVVSTAGASRSRLSEKVGDLPEPVAELRAVVAVADRAAVRIGDAGHLVQCADVLPDVGLAVAVTVGDALEEAGGGDRRIEAEEQRDRAGGESISARVPLSFPPLSEFCY